MHSQREIAWLAGLLEGEGAFMDSKGTPMIALQMTDFDVLEKAAAVLGIAVQGHNWKPKGKPSYKPVRAVRAHGTRAISWMMMLYGFLGQRRKQKIREILERWKASPRSPRGPRGQRFMADCHPDRVRAAHGICDACYMRERRAKYSANRREARAVAASLATFT